MINLLMVSWKHVIRTFNKIAESLILSLLKTIITYCSLLILEEFCLINLDSGELGGIIMCQMPGIDTISSLK